MLFLNKRDVLEEYLETRKLTECFPQYKGSKKYNNVINVSVVQNKLGEKLAGTEKHDVVSNLLSF